MLTDVEKQALIAELGKQAVKEVNDVIKGHQVTIDKMVLEVTKGGVSKETFDEFKTSQEAALASFKAIAEKQGSTLTDIAARLTGGAGNQKSIKQILSEDIDELKQIKNNGMGTKTYMITIGEKGQLVMSPHDVTATKAAGPNATIADVTTAGNVASISQALDAATLLRVGAGSPIFSQYRNTPYIFDLCNIINGSPNERFAMWFDEQAKVGSSAAVLEGGSKPLTQYKYVLQSSTYKKEATLVAFTEEFDLDFGQLESDILGKARIDVINRINSAIVANINTAATAYNTSAQFLGAGTDPITNVNDIDAIAAMAAQVDSATFGGSIANAALISTYKKHRLGIIKDTQGRYLEWPMTLGNIALVGNPGFGTDIGSDNVIVGDFKQYNILLKGGLIVRVGYNGTDFAENKFSVVIEQYYFDYISSVRTPALVKGPDFATVKQAIGGL